MARPVKDIQLPAGPLCFTCKAKPAEGTSAYCTSCAPRDQRPVIGGAWVCAVCGTALGNLGAFDQHQIVDYSAPHPITCKDPATLELIRDAKGTWMTPEGLRRKQRVAASPGWRGRHAVRVP